MAEHWELVVEHEINFCLNYPNYKQELKERLLENEMITYPTTKVDYALGKIYFSQPDVEEQTIRKLETREALCKLLKHAEARLERLLGHYHQLPEHEQLVLRLVYFEKDMLETEKVRRLKLRNPSELEKEKTGALKLLYKNFITDRKCRENEFRIMLFEERKKKERAIKQQLIS